MMRMTMLAASIGMLFPAAGQAADPPPLALEAKIPLGAVAGRIDHFAFDADRHADCAERRLAATIMPKRRSNPAPTSVLPGPNDASRQMQIEKGTLR